MWVAIVLAIIAILMVAFMPKPNVENARAAKLGDFQVPRARYGDPIPLVWGRVRQKSPVTLWYGYLRAVPIKKKVPSGLFSSKRVTVGYKYYLTLDLALAIGPNVHLKRIWAANKEIWTGSLTTDTSININLPTFYGGDDERGGLVGKISFYTGANNTTQNAWLQQVLEPDVPAYNGICRVVFEDFYFGTSTNIDTFSFELQYQPTGLDPSTAIMPNGMDINPMEICYDAFTRRWGRFGNSATIIDLPSWQAAAQKLYDEGVGMSLMVQSTITGADFLEEIMRQCDGILYQNLNKIVCKLIRQDYTVGTLPVLDDSIIDSITDFSKTTWENTFNQCRVTFKDRSNNYDDSTAVERDFANINFQARVKSNDITAPGCTTGEVAQMLAARQLSFLNIPLYKCTLSCNRKAAPLNPGDTFVLNWDPFGLFQMVMRVSKIGKGTLTKGKVKVECVQDRYASAQPVFAPPDQPDFTPPSLTPVPVVTREIFPAPFFLGRINLYGQDGPDTYAAQGRMYICAEAPGQSSIYFDARYSSNNFASPSTNAMSSVPYNGSGTLVAAYAASVASATKQDTVGFTVTGLSQNEIDSLVNNANLNAARDGSSVLKIDDEFFVYVGFTNNGDGSVSFSNVYRAIFDSEPADHALGARVWFISGQDGMMEQRLANSGNHYFKLLDATPTAKLSESEAPTVTVAMTNRMARPYPPDYLQLNSSRTPAPVTAATSVAVSWRRRSRLTQDLRVYNDTEDTVQESGMTTRMRWRIDAGAYTTVNGLTGNSTTINVTGLSGTLEVLVDTVVDGVFSLTADRLTMTLNP